MRKLFLLLLAFLFPFSAFAQNDTEYTMKVETDLVKYNKDVKTLEVPFYFINDNWNRLNPSLLLNHSFCWTSYYWEDEQWGNLQVEYIGQNIKYGLLYATFDLSNLQIYWDTKIILRATNFLGCYFWEGSIKNTDHQDYLTYTIRNHQPIFGCTNPSSPNYDPQATDDDWTCQDNRPRPQNITGFFETSKVNHWATTWTMTLNTSIENAFLDISKIQTWNKFTPVSFYNQDKKIIITIKQFDDKRLDVECTNYELTIPKNALTTSNGDKNDEVITGNFIVENCPTIPANSDDSDNSWTGAVAPEKDAELNSQSTYMPLIFRKDWVFYLDFKAFGLMALYFFLIFSFWYIIFKFFKK